jgi:hypothetical protein
MTMKTIASDPAFPVPRVDIDCLPPACLGLTKREFAAIEAMKGMLANDCLASFAVEAVEPGKIAREAIAFADALFAALNREAE